MTKRNEEDWHRLHESAICAFISGKSGQDVFNTYEQIVDEAIWCADYLVEELKKREKE